MEYEQILERMHELSDEMNAACEQGDISTALEKSREIGQLYFPHDNVQAGRIAYLVNCIATDARYAAILSVL